MRSTGKARRDYLRSGGVFSAAQYALFAIIFSPKVTHSSLPNRSRNPRRNLVAQYGAPYQRLIASRLEPWTGRPVADLR